MKSNGIFGTSDEMKTRVRSPFLMLRTVMVTRKTNGILWTYDEMKNVGSKPLPYVKDGNRNKKLLLPIALLAHVMWHHVNVHVPCLDFFCSLCIHLEYILCCLKTSYFLSLRSFLHKSVSSCSQTDRDEAREWAKPCSRKKAAKKVAENKKKTFCQLGRNIEILNLDA
jgi:hypothetical protein